MAKPKAARRLTGARERAEATARRTTRRPSGYQHRKKAKVRRTTHPLVVKVLNFASYGIWLLSGSTRIAWLCTSNPPRTSPFVFSPTLAVLENDVLACLRRIQRWQRKGRTDGELVPENAFSNTSNAASKEGKERGFLDDTFREVLKAADVCYLMLKHLEEDDRWRNVHQCATCGRWYFERKHDPQQPGKPYCGPRCWPSKSFRDFIAPGRRVQPRKTKTPARGV